MHMTFEKIDPPEHPAARAARTIKELHQETIALVDSGTVFTKDGADVNSEVKDACLKQIDVCNQIIERAQHMPVSLAGVVHMILKDLEDLKEKRMKVVPDELPEIGNYDHKENT